MSYSLDRPTVHVKLSRRNESREKVPLGLDDRKLDNDALSKFIVLQINFVRNFAFRPVYGIYSELEKTISSLIALQLRCMNYQLFYLFDIKVRTED